MHHHPHFHHHGHAPHLPHAHNRRQLVWLRIYVAMQVVLILIAIVFKLWLLIGLAVFLTSAIHGHGMH